MDRRSSGFLLVWLISLVFALSGCVGKSSSNSGNGSVQTVTLSPSADVSLELGTTQSFTATAHNGRGQIVFDTIHFSSSNNASLTIANNGQACAGTWDSLSAPVVCTPGVAGVADIAAVVDGVSSVPTTVYVHQHIESIQVAPVGKPTFDCFSQGQTWDYQASVYGANGVDITNSVGPLTWAAATPNVLTVDTGVKGLLNNQIQVTAENPGVTQLFASVSGTTSAPFLYTTCLVKSILLQIQNGSGTSVTINAGSTRTIEATVLDTQPPQGNIVNKPPLTWSTTNPEVATVNNGTITARQNLGGADIFASCTPPTCNIGVLPGLPVYSSGGTLPNGQPGFGVITVKVTNTKIPTYAAWTATTDCGDNLNCTSAMFAVTPGNTPIGTTVTLPYTPNSLIFNPQGTRAYLGSSKGLMFVDIGQNASVSTVSPAISPCNVAVCGKPLAISPDGNRVAVSDTTTIPNQVYIFDAAHPANAPADLLIPGATAAAFSPDGLKLFILSDSGAMYVDSAIDALTSVLISGPATDVAFSADGSFAYVAGTPGATVSAFSTCALPGIGSVDLGNVVASTAPLRIVPSPNVQVSPSFVTQNILALEPPNIEVLTAQFTQDPIVKDNQFTCNPPILQSFTKGPSANLGQGTFTPVYAQLVGDGSQVIVLAQHVPAVLIFDVTAGTTSAVPLANNGVPLAASASTDGSQIFVAACEAFKPDGKTCVSGSVHIVNTQAGGDIQQAVYTNLNTKNSMCNNLDPATQFCLPNLIAVRPQ